MPSNRAILADIAEFGLDPHVAHTSVSSSGRLRPHNHSSHVSKHIKETKLEQQEIETKTEVLVEQSTEADITDSEVNHEPKNALVELPAAPAPTGKKGKSKKSE